MKLLPRLTVLAPLLVFLSGSVQGNGLRVQLGLNFTAATFGPINQIWIPPDTMGAVGTDHIVEFVNGQFHVYRKSDGTLLHSQATPVFWTLLGLPVLLTGDPRVLYDTQSQRWFVVEIDTPETHRGGFNYFLLAVSRTSNPLEGWTGFRIKSDSMEETWADLPLMGIDADAVYLWANDFVYGYWGDYWAGTSTVVVLPKNDLTRTTPTIENATIIENESGVFTCQPVVNHDGSGFPGTCLAADFMIERWNFSGDITSPVLRFDDYIDVSYGGGVSEAEQPGPKRGIETAGPSFRSYVVRRNGAFWATQEIGVDGREAIRWLQIDAATNNVLQEGIISDEELDLYYPSIAVNEFDDVVIGFNGSSEWQFVSAYAMAGQTVEGYTTLGERMLLKEGVADYERFDSEGRNRWGDYSTTVVDPTDPRVFWTFQAFVSETDKWGTQISEIRLLSNRPPVADAGAARVVECESFEGAQVTLDGTASSDPDGDSLGYAWTGPFGTEDGPRPTVALPLGTHTITLVVDDGSGGAASDTVQVTVADTVPPALALDLTPDTLQPANHRLMRVEAGVSASDACGSPEVVLASVASSEPDDAPGVGDGNTADDIQGAAVGTADFEFLLRAERSGSGEGRFYTVTYTAVDEAGNAVSRDAVVSVPHDQRK